tara:strand:+ start:129 stop:701 length:573 start_codon:yes stop_codon:yes gene_type:complete
MTFYKDFLPSQQFKLIEEAVNKNIEEVKASVPPLLNPKNYKKRSGPNWSNFISEEYLQSLIAIPNPYAKKSNKMKVKTPSDLTNVLINIFPEYKLKESGYFYYPKEGFMGWHTNHNETEDRLYITFAEEDKQSFFRYYENGSIITDYDNKGITIRRFSIPSKPPYFWHCVGSYCRRFSFGYKMFPISKKI